MSKVDNAPSPLPPKEQAKLIETFEVKNFSSIEELISGLRELQRQGVTAFIGSHGNPHPLSHQIQRLEELIHNFRSSVESGTIARDARRHNLHTLKVSGFREIVAEKLLPLVGEFEDTLGIPK